MKLRKAIKVAVAGAALAPVVAMAAAPQNFGNWTDTGSGITAGCTGGFTCAAGTTSGDSVEGFLQRNITDANGNTYIQTVITGDTGQISDESFVQVGGSGGIADRSKINSTEGGTNFDSTASILTGAFFTGSDKGLDFNQKLSASDANTTFTAGFQYSEQDASVILSGTMSSGLYAKTTLTGFVSDAEGMDATFTQTEIEVIEANASETTAAEGQYSKGLYVANNVTDTNPSEPMTQDFLIREAEGPNMVASVTTLTGNLSGSSAFTVAAGGSFESMQLNQDVAGQTYGTEQYFNTTPGGTGSNDVDSFGGEVAALTIAPDPF